MCYGTRITRKAAELERYYNIERLLGDIEEDAELTHFHANGWAHPNMWILPQQRRAHMIPAKWGIMPSTSIGNDYVEYFKNNRGAFGGLNLRSEDVFGNYMFSDNVLSKRCVIPVDGFFEPHTTSVKVKGKHFKVPFYFRKKDSNPLNLAGIYNVTKDKMVTFSIFTKEATPLFELIHNQPSNKHKDYRRPVVLDDSEAEYWLEEGHEQSDLVDILDNDVRDYEFDTWPVSKDLYKAEGNRFDIIEKIEYEEVSINY